MIFEINKGHYVTESAIVEVRITGDYKKDEPTAVEIFTVGNSEPINLVNEQANQFAMEFRSYVKVQREDIRERTIALKTKNGAAKPASGSSSKYVSAKPEPSDLPF